MSTFLPRSATAAVAATAISLSVLSGCATPPPASDKEAVAEFEQTNDPMEPMNRAIFDFNMAADRAIFKPVAQHYRDYVPQYGRDRIHDFLNNWRSPLILANDILQGNPDHAMQTLMRFAFNTGFGAFGLVDLASAGGIPYHEEDLGQTFAVWGVGEGPYLVLPILGPSNARDATGLAAEWVVDPVSYRLNQTGYGWASLPRAAIAGVDKREHNIESLDDVERNAMDLYSTIRSLYRQYRDAQIKNQPDVSKMPAPGLTSSIQPETENPQETHLR